MYDKLPACRVSSALTLANKLQAVANQLQAGSLQYSITANYVDLSRP